ncbi:MAG TPA: extracellular solute-binding protein [Clostridiales bacterium]|nr:extracellular solute-binding protein [Clostridiales bacterium]
MKNIIRIKNNYLISKALVLVILLLTLLSSCNSGKIDVSYNEKSINEKTNEASDSATVETDSHKNVTSIINPIVEEKITLKMLCQANQDLNNDMPVLQELERLTNVHLEFEILPAVSAERWERFAAAMAAREPFDLVTYQYRNDINKYGMEGVFVPLNNLIKEHAPNLYEKLKDPLGNEPVPYKTNVLQDITAPDGNIYNVPLISTANAIGAVWAIRKDWLDKLGFQSPGTIDELYEVLKAFKKNDPNGNGLSDEIPLGITGEGTLVYSLLPLINGFGAHITLYLDKTDDTIKYGPVESVWKEGMLFLTKLYKEELIDPDWTTSSKDGWIAQVSTNQLGMMYTWPISGIGAANIELMKIDKNYHFIAIPPFKAPNGDRFKDTSTAGNIVVPRTAITATNKYPVETIKYLDFLFTDAGNRVLRYGIAGIHYDMVNGKPVVKKSLLTDTTGQAAKDGIDIAPLPYISLWEKGDQFKAVDPNFNPEEDAHYIYRQPGMVEAPLPALQFLDSELYKGPNAFKAINSYAYSKWTPFITGEESLEKHDDYVKQIKTLGIDEVLKIYNSAYKRYKQLGK